MSGDSIHTLYRSATGNWANEAGSRGYVRSVHATKEEAVRHGRALALADQASHVIHNMDGTISTRRSYGNRRVGGDAGPETAGTAQP